MPDTRKLILVVDDCDDSRTLFADILEAEGFRVVTAASGREAIEKVRALQPAAVTMDLSMPDVDGFEATRVIKGDPATRHIAVLALSGHSEPQYLAEAWAAEVDDILVKPCNSEALVARVNELVLISQRSLRAAQE